MVAIIRNNSVWLKNNAILIILTALLSVITYGGKGYIDDQREADHNFRKEQNALREQFIETLEKVVRQDEKIKGCVESLYKICSKVDGNTVVIHKNSDAIALIQYETQ